MALASHLTAEQRTRAERLAKLERIYDRLELRAWTAERTGRFEDADRLYRMLDTVNARISVLL